jgi:RNA polymerase sigma-70 factor (ECF subfamily)
MLGQWQDAEDAVQETFVRVSRGLPGWNSERAFEPWLLAIAANRCRTLIKRRTRQVATEPLAETEHAEAVSSSAPLTGHFREELELAMHHLPAPWADALTLFHLEGLSYQEIAERRGCAVGTAKTWVHRGRRALLERLRKRGIL